MANLSESDQLDHNRAEAARRIIEDPLVIETMAAMEQYIFETWRDERLSPDDREELHRLQTTLNRFVIMFDAYLQNGAIPRQILGLPPEEKTFFQRIREFINGNKKA